MGKPTRAQRQRKAQKRAQPAKKPLSRAIGKPIVTPSTTSDDRNRINDLIQAISKPETVIDHIQRTGAEYWIAPVGISQSGVIVERPCLIVPWDVLMDKEYQYLKAGGQLKSLMDRQRQTLGPAVDQETMKKFFTSVAEGITQAAKNRRVPPDIG